MIEATLQSKPNGQTHWSCRTLAKAYGVSKNTVNRLWQLHNLKPHLSSKLSRDPKFLEKLTDVVGLYLNPPQKAVILCVDEKSQIQALDRTQPGLPLKKGRCGTCTHDYKRNGTTTLFAALDVLQGKVIGQCHSRHRQQQWMKFLRQLDKEYPAEVPLHLVMDNYGTHKAPAVQKWLSKHPRFVCHFIPTSSSWLNLVERWFRELSDKAIRRGTFVYSRCTIALKGVEGFLKFPPAEKEVRKALKRLHKILAPVERELPLRPQARYLCQRARLFDELRRALRLAPSKNKVRPQQDSASAGELSDIRKEVQALLCTLQSRRDECAIGSDTYKAIGMIIRHIDKHGESLWGHEIELPAGGTRLVDRTNNFAEGFFRDMKHDERRRSGRKVLTQDFEHLPPEAALARNLRREDYVAIVCGSIDRLPKSFAHLDAEERLQRLSGVGENPVKSKPQQSAEIASASLPSSDKRLVRTVRMKQLLQAAAGV
ncbi:MAG TPA: IS630 family transposase [Nitrospiraceae bacterium]|nr:IS630 family transposase [Nitrospiraceae bacterium]